MGKDIKFRKKISQCNVLMIVLLIGSLLSSCRQDELIELTIPSRISFENNSYTIQRNPSDGLVITFSLTRPLESKGTVVIKIDSNSTAIGTEYSLSPELASGNITLKLGKGDSTASIKITSAKNFDDDKNVVFTISYTTGGVILDKSNLSSVITMIGNKIPLPEIATSLPNLVDFGTVDKDAESTAKSYYLSGKNLTENISVEASNNFKVSLDNVAFSNTVSISYIRVNSSPVEVFVKFTPHTAIDQNLTGTITNTTSGVTMIVNVSGVETGNYHEVLLLIEDFNYGATVGNLTSVSNMSWNGYSGIGLTPVKYTVPGLSFTGYTGSNIGGAASSTNGSGSREDVSIPFTPQTSGVLYTAQMVNVARSSAQEFFYSLRNDGGTSFNRIYAQDNGSGKLILSMAKNTGPTSSVNLYEYGTTYLVVIKYDFTTQVSTMYVLSGSIPVIEPTTADAVSSTGTSPLTLNEVIIRQAGGILDATVDGIRIGTTWKGLLGL